MSNLINHHVVKMTLKSTILSAILITQEVMAKVQPECVNGMCMDKNHVSEQEVTSKLGRAKRKKFDSFEAGYCYQFQNGKKESTYAFFGIGERKNGLCLTTVRMSHNKICQTNTMSQQDLVIDGLVRLGSTQEQVINAFGNPTRKVKIDSSEQRRLASENFPNDQFDLYLQYDKHPDELLFARFYFVKGMVRGILISNNE